MLKSFINFEKIFSLIILLFIFIFNSTPINSIEVFFHLKNGEYIYNHGIPIFDPYSIHDGLKYVQHQWLSSVIFYLIYTIKQFLSLWIFKIAISYILFFVCYKTIKCLTEGNKTLSFISSGLIVIILSSYIDIYPQIFTIMILLVQIFLLEIYEKTDKFYYLIFIVPLAALSANVNGALSPILFIPILFYLISNFIDMNFGHSRLSDMVYNRRRCIHMLVTLFISMVSMFINPNGWRVSKYWLDIDSIIINYVGELNGLSIDRHPGIFITFFSIVCIMVVTRNKITIKQVLFIFGSFAINLVTANFNPFFLLFSLIFTTQYIGKVILSEMYQIYLLDNRIVKVLGLVIILIMFAFSIPVVNTSLENRIINISQMPIKIVELLKKENNLRLFNPASLGYYLIFNDVKVFADERFEMYTQQFNPINIAEENYGLVKGYVSSEKIVDKYKLNFLLTYRKSPMNLLLQYDNKYDKKYEDENYVLYEVRK